MPELTVVISYAPYHAEIMQRALDSVLTQTIPCNVLTIEDKEGHGAGWARNEGLRQVKTPFVSFLDADDTIEPEFAEKCLMIWGVVRSKRYVYTNWIDGVTGRIHIVEAPCDMWKHIELAQLPPEANPENYEQRGNLFHRSTWHPITTLIPTEYARKIGGFDEAMPALEDSDFYKRLIISGVCGIHLNNPLFSYREGGQRSINAYIEQDGIVPAHDMMIYMVSRYGEYTMGCCGGNAQQNNTPVGARRDGDVLAMAQWAGNRQERGRVTGRLYPRMSLPKVAYVDPSDVAASPNLWKKVSAVPQTLNPVLQPGYAPGTADWGSAANIAFGGRHPAPVPAQMEWQEQPLENTRSKTEVLKIARRNVK